MKLEILSLDKITEIEESVLNSSLDEDTITFIKAVLAKQVLIQDFVEKCNNESSDHEIEEAARAFLRAHPLLDG